MENNERRSYDKAIKQIAIDVNTIKTRQEDYIKLIDNCVGQTKTNTENITILKTKVGFITYIGSGAFLIAIGTILRNYFKS